MISNRLICNYNRYENHKIKFYINNKMINEINIIKKKINLNNKYNNNLHIKKLKINELKMN